MFLICLAEKGVVFNASDACKEFGLDGNSLDKIWAEAKKNKQLVKFGGGFYCGKLQLGDEEKKEVFVFNGFFSNAVAYFSNVLKTILSIVILASLFSKWPEFCLRCSFFFYLLKCP